MSLRDKYPTDYVHYGILDELSAMVNHDPKRIPKPGWTGTLRQLGEFMSIDPEIIAHRFGESLAEHDEEGIMFDISLPPAPTHHGDLKQIPQWRIDAAHAIDPATTQDLLRGR